MGCGCSGAKTVRAGTSPAGTYPVTLPDGSVRNYLTEAEQQAALRGLARQARQARNASA